MQVFNNKRGLNSLADGDLILMIQEGLDSESGRSAAEVLFGRYRRRVYLMCYRYVGEHERALDISQEVLLKAYEAIGRYKHTSEFSCWLFTIARNRCLNSLRSVRLWNCTEADPESLPDGGTRPDQDIEEREDEERMLELIRKTLDPVEQKAVWLRCFEKVPVDEITEMLGIESASGARAVLQKCRRKLRAAMNKG
jgi:RNA polymerase sigma-70 factor (ECF subfamily)